MKTIYKGIVTEVRIYQGDVYLFVKAQHPAKVNHKIVRFSLNNLNCEQIQFAAKLALGADVTIEKIKSSFNGCHYRYDIQAYEDIYDEDGS